MGLERARVQASLADTSAELAIGAARLKECLYLVADPARLYDDAPDHLRRQLNQALFERFLIDDGDAAVVITDDVLRTPFDEIRDAERSFRLGERYARVTPSVQSKSPPLRTDLVLLPLSWPTFIRSVFRVSVLW